MGNPYREGDPIADIERRVSDAEATAHSALSRANDACDAARDAREIAALIRISRSLIAAVFVLAVVGSTTYLLALRIKYPAPPAPPPQCQESARILDFNNVSRECPPGATLSTEAVNKNTIVRCSCPRAEVK